MPHRRYFHLSKSGCLQLRFGCYLWCPWIRVFYIRRKTLMSWTTFCRIQWNPVCETRERTITVQTSAGSTQSFNMHGQQVRLSTWHRDVSSGSVGVRLGLLHGRGAR